MTAPRSALHIRSGYTEKCRPRRVLSRISLPEPQSFMHETRPEISADDRRRGPNGTLLATAPVYGSFDQQRRLSRPARSRRHILIYPPSTYVCFVSFVDRLQAYLSLLPWCTSSPGRRITPICGAPQTPQSPHLHNPGEMNLETPDKGHVEKGCQAGCLWSLLFLPGAEKPGR